MQLAKMCFFVILSMFMVPFLCAQKVEPPIHPFKIEKGRVLDFLLEKPVSFANARVGDPVDLAVVGPLRTNDGGLVSQQAVVKAHIEKIKKPRGCNSGNVWIGIDYVVIDNSKVFVKSITFRQANDGHGNLRDHAATKFAAYFDDLGDGLVWAPIAIFVLPIELVALPFQVAVKIADAVSPKSGVDDKCSANVLKFVPSGMHFYGAVRQDVYVKLGENSAAP